MAPGMAAQMGVTWSPLHASGFHDLSPRIPQDKTLGEFSELPGSYEGNYRPARVGLVRVLESGKMRNPLQMQQSQTDWAARRPLSASKANRLSRGGLPSSPGRGGQLSSRGLKPHDHADKVAASTSTAAVGAGVTQRPPGMLQPQRIELPSYLNTPARRPDGEPLLPEERTVTLRKMKDFEMLTFACRRASKLREEGRAHFSLGVLRDNLGQYQKAIDAYIQFLRVCKELLNSISWDAFLSQRAFFMLCFRYLTNSEFVVCGLGIWRRQECSDSQGGALGYHCIGVDYQLLGIGAHKGEAAAEGENAGKSPASPSPALASLGPPPARTNIRPDLLRKAIYYHNRHRENSDSIGKFVAHLNMGLAYAHLGEPEASTVNHQYALRYALQLHSLEGQSLAIGSLSFSAGIYDSDPEKMKVLVERYVDLCGTLKQTKNQAAALKKLGILASQQGQNEQSIDYFTQAIEAARAEGDQEAEKDCSVRLGIAAGQAKMADHISSILQTSMLGMG
eukprot:s3927_g3.t1